MVVSPFFSKVCNLNLYFSHWQERLFLVSASGCLLLLLATLIWKKNKKNLLINFCLLRLLTFSKLRLSDCQSCIARFLSWGLIGRLDSVWHSKNVEQYSRKENVARISDTFVHLKWDILNAFSHCLQLRLNILYFNDLGFFSFCSENRHLD